MQSKDLKDEFFIFLGESKEGKLTHIVIKIIIDIFILMSIFACSGN